MTNNVDKILAYVLCVLCKLETQNDLKKIFLYQNKANRPRFKS